ncbi:hypothetical protein BGAL_0128g00140 [Botrytis galanthina]|uniref:Enoyl reductase (ER) domain-containing protein n=1 Tax=Botrytis galanthina TaxID=278940 RepID=A0A4S8R9L9_9HELO|nr:hypothetical protein BGAL_0128g00140 [Botrytis galanthina]
MPTMKTPYASCYSISSRPQYHSQDEKSQVTIERRPKFDPALDELIIGTYAIAANPNLFVTSYPNVLSGNFSDTIESVGSSITKFDVGERVTGFAAVIYNGKIYDRVWQSCRETATTNILDDLSFEDASTFPMAMAMDKVAIGFYLLLDFLRMLGRRKKSNEGMLIWGDTSSVRTVVIQLCNLAGYIVFTTAREKHYKYLESTGATATFNYRDPEVVRNIARKVNTSNMYLTIGFDATLENDTPQLPADISSAKGHGKSKLGLTLPWPK